jgi:hypothetical protein
MEKFTTITLDNYYNSSRVEPYPKVGAKPRWDEGTINALNGLTLGEVCARGIPFSLADPEATAHLIVLPASTDDGKQGKPIALPIGKKAHFVCLGHSCARRDDDELNPAIGIEVARYTLVYEDGSEHTTAIRRRFEINPLGGGVGGSAFVAETMRTSRPLRPGEPGQWGWAQTGVSGDNLPGIWIYAMPNPNPQKEIKELRLQALTADGVAIFGITLAHFPDHPLRHWPRNTFRLSLPESVQVMPADLTVNLDMGHITRLYPDPGLNETMWLDDSLTGLGSQAKPPEPGRNFMVEATGSKAASFQIKAGEEKFELSYGEALKTGESRDEKGARVELCHPHKTWVHVKVIDEEIGKPVPTRTRFLGPRGEYLPPYGHPAEVNTNWFEDEGGNIVLGGDTFAYLPGEFQIELPVGDVFVELHKGFEYEPTRKKLNIETKTRELTLKVRRFSRMREKGFVTADTHVHFLSPQTAWLEGQCEGLNLVNLLASQWGKLFTNVGDITGKLSGCSEQDTIVFVGTENRHHMLGHISMLGTQGMPVFPMCTGGPGEAWFGDADIRSQADWADECRAKGGVVIRPHFPSPNCEVAADIVTGKVDAVEVRAFGIINDTLDSSPIREWYRYLNCGYRVPAAGGTDKMSAGMPVGGVRTYAQLDPNDEFNFDNWGKAVRAGRTFTTSGPLIGITADGREVGDEIRMPASGGTIETEAWAVCAQPIHGLEIIHNGKIVAKTSSTEGAKRLELKEKIKIDGSGWLAARCYSYHRVWHVWPVNVAAHTSPIYVVVNNQEVFNPSDAVYIMTLVHGGMEWLDTLSIKADEQTHQRLRSIFEIAERELKGKLEAHGK